MSNKFAIFAPDEVFLVTAFWKKYANHVVA